MTNKNSSLKRKHKASFTLNDKELEAIEVYCKKYKIKNRSKFLRESVLKTVMIKFFEDYPTLFEKQDLDKLVVKD
ncbi:hypothetical protein QA597_02200 [Marinilabiliaceae bacterium ANBcel2]|nr:hypothetical protein [Marinilabiliaceae bacterium ANBcel2]